MKTSKLHELDITGWVEQATGNMRTFREAVHIILVAICNSQALAPAMIMKGGLLMAIRYHSERYTKDIDFSTKEKYRQGDEEALLAELAHQLDLANQQLPYDTMCRFQKAQIKPAATNTSFPTLSINIGYARRSKNNDLKRLNNGQASNLVQIDYSYNEAVYDVDTLALEDGEQLKTYSYFNLFAEKLRSLLQQPIRNRTRRQDVYDLYVLLQLKGKPSAQEQQKILQLLKTTCAERDVPAHQKSFAAPEIRNLARAGYDNLAAEVPAQLPDFDQAFDEILRFYEELPWDRQTE